MREFCSTRITEMPSSRLMATIERAMSCTSFGAMPSEGSSSNRSFGLDISARLMTSICCSPPLMVPASWLQRSLSRGKRISAWSIRAAVSPLSARVKAPISRLSFTDMKGNTRRPSGTMAMPRRTIWSGERPSMRSPSKWISPLDGRFNPVMARSVVVLPAPLAPISATISPLSTVMVTPFSACTWS